MTAQGPAATIDREQPSSLRSRSGRDDVAGFAVIGQPFASGDLLCLRSFPASTFGPGYVSVWHRAVDGQWTVYTSVSPEQSCPRFIGAAASHIVEGPIELAWRDQSELIVRVPTVGLTWTLHLATSPVTRVMNLMMAAMPAALFDSNVVLGVMSLMSTLMLSAGRLQLGGHVPNGQWFQAAPRRVWFVSDASASIGGRDLGAPRALAAQALLGTITLPQRGIVMMGRFSFEAYVTGRHLPAQRG